MTDSDNNKIPEEAVRTLEAVWSILGESIVGAYLFGSAVVGGLRPDSDVDVLVIVDRSLTDNQRKTIVGKLMNISGRVGSSASARPIELTIVNRTDVVPWRYPPGSELVYGEWLRDEFEKGRIPGPARDPDLAIVLQDVRVSGVALFGPEASEALDPVPMADILRAMGDSLPGLIDGMKGDERNALLTLARMWLTAATGGIATKNAAAEWAISRLPGELAYLLDSARRAYLGKCGDDWKAEESKVRELAAYMRKSIEDCLAA
jgi:streptomycin 3"-adenylyltransferase